MTAKWGCDEVVLRRQLSFIQNVLVEVKGERQYCFWPLISLSKVEDLPHEHKQVGNCLWMFLAEEISYDG